MAWGYLFVPIQAGFLPLPVIELLLIVQLLMKPLAFGLLFQFGVEIMLSTRDPAMPLPRTRGRDCASCRRSSS